MTDISLHQTVVVHGSWKTITRRELVLAGGGAAVIGLDGKDDGADMMEIVRSALRLLGEAPDDVALQAQDWWNDCEDCGSYQDVAWVISRKDVQIIRFYQDGHFGNGDDLHDIDNLAGRVLEALGHKLEVVQSGVFVRELHGALFSEDDAFDDAESHVDASDGLAFHLCFENVTGIGGYYLDAILHRLPVPARVIVPSRLYDAFREELDWVEQHGNFSSHLVPAIRSALVIDGSVDQARRISPDLLQRYLNGEETADREVQGNFPMLTYAAIREVAREKGVAAPC